MRELRVEDALMYLDQVKMEFGDRPHIYNEFLDIMKTFKSQTIDTPGVIRRVASLFHGNKRLVLGFNTFLPEGYRIELPLDGSAWPVYREPGRSGVIAIAPPSSSSSAAAAAGEMPGQAGGHPPGASSGGPRGPTTTGPPAPLSRMMRPGPNVGQHGTTSGMPPSNMGRGGGVGGGHPPSSGMQLHQHQQQQQQHHLQQQQHQAQQPSHGMARGVGPSQFGAPAPTQRTGSVGLAPYPGGAPAPSVGMLKGPPPHPSQPGGVMGAAGGGVTRPSGGMGPPSHHPSPPSSTGRGPSIHPGPPPISAPGAAQPSHSHSSSGGGGAALSSSSSTTVLGGGAGAGSGTAQPIEFDHAINYVTTIKRRFASHPEIYRKFLEILHTYQKEQRGIKEVLDEVSVLFADHADLLKEFTYFLPDAVQSQAKAQLDVAAKKAEDRARAREQQQQQSVAAAAALAGAAAASSAAYTTGHEALSSRNDASTTKTAMGTTMLQHQQPTSMGGGGGGPDHSTMVQHQHQPPNLPPPPPSSSSTGGRYGAGPTIHTSPRSEPTVPSHIAKIPFGATKGRSEDREREISRGAVHGIVSFGPSRPPRRHELNPAQAAQVLGRPTTIPLLPLQPMTSESAFLERVKSHFLRCDLFPDKPIVNRKQTPYMEFLKCLHLFGVGIINKDELIQLLRGLFIQGNIPKNASNNSTNVAATHAAMGLLTELERVLVGRGPFATQEQTKKLKGRYGGYPIREYEFANPSISAVVTPSYRAYPADYAFDKLSAEMEKDGELLNYKCYCVAPGRSSNDGRSGKYLMSPEYYDGIKLRSNIHEEVLARVEEEIHEVDMAIERNASALRVLEPVAEEAKRLREQEENDGQPIGRLQYKLRNRSLNSIHIGAIARIYGDSGEEVLQHLLRNPLVVVPIVYNRLKEKNEEWRKVKKDMRKEWKSAMSENFVGSLDAKSVYKREIEHCYAAERLIEDCVRAKTFAKHPNKIHRHPATNMILPDFHLMNPDPALALFQPHLSVLVSKSMPHKHAFDLLETCVSRDSNKTNNNNLSLQKSLEFISSWFGLPSQDTPKSENCYASSENYAPGMRVRTVVGDGKIISVAHYPVLRYLLKFDYGIGYVLPDLIVELVPTNELDMDAMNDDDDDDNALHLMPDDIQVLFGTEKIYLFVRLYIILVTMLYQAKDVVDRKNEVSDKQDLFARLVSSLKDTLTGKMDGKEFEHECKKNLDNDAYNFVAIPPLVVKCAAASIKMSKENHFQNLFHYSQLKLQDLNQQRNLSLELTDDATYRLQIQSSASQVFFAYVPADAELQLTNPRDGNYSAPSSSKNERRPFASNVEHDQKRMKTEAENVNDISPP